MTRSTTPGSTPGSTAGSTATALAPLGDGAVVEYRWEPGGGRGVVLVMHGGHMRAALDADDATWLDVGLDLLVPSRPGYGRTSLAAGPDPDRFADSVARLLDARSIDRLRAVVGVSAGAPSALALAARHPDRVARVATVSGVSGIVPWPDRRTRAAARVAFHPRTERFTWALTRWSFRRWPERTLRSMFGALTTGDPGELVTSLDPSERARAIELFTSMRSGSGFLADVRHTRRPDRATAVGCPTLVLATRDDASVPFGHAEALTESIAERGTAELAPVDAASHLVWLGPSAGQVRSLLRDFVLGS